MRRSALPVLALVLGAMWAAPLAAQVPGAADPVVARGRSEASFQQPSLAPGVDYTLPKEE